MQGKNELIVGLDVGTNSVGWAALEYKDGELQRILGSGSRIIPAGDDHTNYEQGKAMAKNADRRMKRSARRNNQRYKLRRANLLKALKTIGIDTGTLGTSEHGKADLISSLDLYGLRAKAVDAPVSLEELARVLYHMSQRRGYKDIGDLMDEAAGITAEEKEEDKSRRTIVERVRIDTVTAGDDKGKKVEYDVTLADGRTGTTYYRVFLELVGKEMELELRERTNKKGELSRVFAIPEKTDWLKGMEELNGKIAAAKVTPGQYFYNELKRDKLYRVREQVVLRDNYKDEFNRIWATQKTAHPALADEAVKKAVVLALIPNNQAAQQLWLKRELRDVIRDYVIYYQRPLKSQASSKGKCRYEPQKPVVPISSPIHQAFRLWQQVGNIRFTDRYGKSVELTHEQRAKLYDHLLDKSELKPEQVAKAVGIKDDGLEVSLRASIAGHGVLERLRKPLKEHPALLESIREELRADLDVQHTLTYRLWHALYSIPEREHRKTALEQMGELTAEQIEILCDVRYERKHGALSARAIHRILPLMRCGAYFSEVAIPDAVKDRIEKIFTGEVDEELEVSVRELFKSKRSVSEFQGMRYWEAASLVYNDHRRTADKPHAEPGEMKAVPRGEMRNSVVEQVVNEVLMVTRDIWATYGRPTSIRVELARELRMNAKERERMFSGNKKRSKERDDIRDELTSRFKIPKPTRKDVERFQLWKDQKFLCMYSGDTIQETMLFSGEVDVDHVIPRTRFFDDSFNNKVLALRKENGAKDKLTAYEYMQGKGTGHWEAFVDRVEALYNGRTLSPRKKKYLLADKIPDDFINRQLNDTRYISTQVVQLLQRVAPGAVYTTIGSVTDHLKEHWKLNRVFKEVMRPRFERLEKIVGRPLIQEVNENGRQDLKMEGWDKRIDHRHHALDAMVVAATQQKFIQRLNVLNRLSDTERAEIGKNPRHFPLPHDGFRDMVRQQLEGMVVSIKNRQRLLTKAVNHYKVLGKDKPVKQKGAIYAVRGALHNEQPLGEIREQRKMELVKFLKSLKGQRKSALELVEEGQKADRLMAVEWQRQLVNDLLQKHDGDVDKAIKALKKEPLSRGGKEVKEVTLLVRKYTMTRNLTPLISAKQIELIVDRGLKKEVEAHLAKFGGDPKKAFTLDGLAEFNAHRATKVLQVRCRMDESEVSNDLDSPRIRMLRPNDPNRKLHVQKGENYALVVYEHMETGERQFQVVSFFDAVQRKLAGGEVAEPIEGYRHFTLTKNELVYIPTADESASTIPWNNSSHIGARLHRLVKFSGNYYYFLPARISSLAGVDVAEYGSQNCTEWMDTDSPRVKISSRAIKVQVNRIGKYEPAVV